MPLEVDVGPDGRYARQELISWWRQERLADARVLVVGAGALGNELVKNLALLGVGTIVIIDLDVIENSNLARCVLFGEHDEGEPKALVLAAAARRLNSDVDAIGIVGDVRTSLGLGVFATCDVVLGGLDNREARVHVNQACWKVNRPWVDGAIEGLMGVMRAFVPPASACYECTMTERDRQLLAARRGCTLLTREEMLAGKVPTTVTSASVIAALQAQEAVKLLHAGEHGYDFGGRGVVFNGQTHDTYAVTYVRANECLSHDSYPREDWCEVPASASFRSLLERATAELGGDSVLEIEIEILSALSCRACEMREQVLRPLATLGAAAAKCPHCEAERVPELLHTITAADELILELNGPELGLPPFDVVTARRGERRVFFQLGEGDALAGLT